MKQLHPSVRWLWRVRTYPTAIVLGSFILTILITPLVMLMKGAYFIAFVFLMTFYFIFVIAVSEVYIHMAYTRWKYEFTPEGLKIEKGVIWKKYTSIPYNRIQNVDIQRGIIARMFGFSTIDVQTAGQSGMQQRRGRRGRVRSEGYIPAVEINEAEKIAQDILKKAKRSNSGL